MIPPQSFIPPVRTKGMSPSPARRYYEDQAQPTNGAEQFANKMIGEAGAKQLVIQEDPALLKHLIEVDLGDSVPPQLYALISEILFLMQKIEEPK